jgi:hypothetical protein
VRVILAHWPAFPRGPAKEKEHGGTIAESSGPVPEFGSQEQESTHDFPYQRRKADWCGNFV